MEFKEKKMSQGENRERQTKKQTLNYGEQTDCYQGGGGCGGIGEIGDGDEGGNL